MIYVNLTEKDHGTFYVYIKGRDHTPLFIQTFPIEAKQNLDDYDDVFVFSEDPDFKKLDPKRKQLIYFGAGEHDVSKPVLLSTGVIDTEKTAKAAFPHIPNNTDVYINGGAFVKGLFETQDKPQNIRFYGKGIISGRDYPHEAAGWSNHMIHYQGYSDNLNSGCEVRDLTLTDCPKTCLLYTSPSPRDRG